MENGTVWSNSSESSDDSSSPALAHHTQRLTASNLLQTTLTNQLSLNPHKSSASTPSLSSNQEEDESEASEAFCLNDTVPNGHLQAISSDCKLTDRASIQSADLSDTSADLSCSCHDVSDSPVPLVESSSVVTPDQDKDLVVQARETDAGAVDIISRAPEEVDTEDGEQQQSAEDLQRSEEALPVSWCCTLSVWKICYTVILKTMYVLSTGSFSNICKLQPGS